MTTKSEKEFEKLIKKEFGNDYSNTTLYVEAYKQFDIYNFINNKAEKIYGKKENIDLNISDIGKLEYYDDVTFKLNNNIINYNCGQFGNYFTVYYNDRKNYINFKNLINNSFLKSEVIKTKCMDTSLKQLGMNNYDVSIFDREDMKVINDEIIGFFKNYEKIKKFNLKKSKGVILYGEPGNGKTTICRFISNECLNLGFNVLWVNSKDIYSIKGVYDFAQFISPCLIIMEDIDKSIGMGCNEMMLGDLLNQLDGAVKLEGIMTIITTNYIERLDKAITDRPGRFDLKINPQNKLKTNLSKHFDKLNQQKYYENVLNKPYNKSDTDKNNINKFPSYTL